MNVCFCRLKQWLTSCALSKVKIFWLSRFVCQTLFSEVDEGDTSTLPFSHTLHISISGAAHDEKWGKFSTIFQKCRVTVIIMNVPATIYNYWLVMRATYHYNVGPEDKIVLLDAEGQGQHFVWWSNISTGVGQGGRRGTSLPLSKVGGTSGFVPPPPHTHTFLGRANVIISLFAHTLWLKTHFFSIFSWLASLANFN